MIVREISLGLRRVPEQAEAVGVLPLAHVFRWLQARTSTCIAQDVWLAQFVVDGFVVVAEALWIVYDDLQRPVPVEMVIELLLGLRGLLPYILLGLRLIL